MVEMAYKVQIMYKNYPRKNHSIAKTTLEKNYSRITLELKLLECKHAFKVNILVKNSFLWGLNLNRHNRA